MRVGGEVGGATPGGVLEWLMPVGGGGGVPPPDPDFINLQTEILIRAICGTQIFGFQTPAPHLLRGRFRTARAQRAHSANYYRVYPGNTPENHPPLQKHASIQNSISGAEFRTLGPVATGGGKQPTFRTARAQRTVRPLTHACATRQRRRRCVGSWRQSIVLPPSTAPLGSAHPPNSNSTFPAP